MNNTEFEYSPEELKAIAIARELHLLGNSATPAGIARFVRAWDTRSATCQAQAALRTTAGKLSDYFADVMEPRIEFVQVPVRLLQQLSVAVKLAEMGPVTAPKAQQPTDGNLLLREDGYPHLQTANYAKLPDRNPTKPAECEAQSEECAACVGTGFVEDTANPIGNGGIRPCDKCDASGIQQPELQIKWTTVPTTYQYAAMDADGRVFAYSDTPIQHGSYHAYHPGDTPMIYYPVRPGNIISRPPLDQWKNSVIKRPE